MTFDGLVRSSLRRSLALVIGVTLAVGGAPGLLAQSSSATITGVILDPTGRPAFGFKAVAVDSVTKLKYVSAPTDAAGNYTITVPVGGSYKLESVVADDGVTRLAVQDVASISILTEGTTRLNVRFTDKPARATESESTEDEKRKRGAGPWYRRPGPIVGLVLGSVAVGALLLGSDNTASRSTP